MEHSDNGLFIKRERFEVLAILREICKQRTPLRVENQQHRFQSLLLSVGPDNIVFSGEEAASAIDGACTIVIESNDAKIEFSVGQAELTEHQGVGLLDPSAAGAGLHSAPSPVPHHHAALAPILLHRRIPGRYAL